MGPLIRRGSGAVSSSDGKMAVLDSFARPNSSGFGPICINRVQQPHHENLNRRLDERRRAPLRNLRIASALSSKVLICLRLGVVKVLPIFDHVSAGGKKSCSRIAPCHLGPGQFYRFWNLQGWSRFGEVRNPSTGFHRILPAVSLHIRHTGHAVGLHSNDVLNTKQSEIKNKQLFSPRRRHGKDHIEEA